MDLHGAAVHRPHQTEKAWAAFVPSTAGYALLMGTAEKMHGRHQNHSDLTEVNTPSYITESLITSPHPIKWATWIDTYITYGIVLLQYKLVLIIQNNLMGRKNLPS